MNIDVNKGMSGHPAHWPTSTSLHEFFGYGRLDFDPIAKARHVAANMRASGKSPVDIQRMKADAPWVNWAEVMQGLITFHREAMARIPSYTIYPEAKQWVEYQQTYCKELQKQSGMSEQELAFVISFGKYMMFRGYRQYAPASGKLSAEKCRVAFLLETDRGPLHIKNVDDPITNWRPSPPLPASCPKEEFWWNIVEYIADGTGSGLHIDNEPSELFPLPVFYMAGQYAHDTHELVEFLRRYTPFWGGGNLLIYDRQMQCMAIEKTSHNYFETFAPDHNGHTHISGMVCRDVSSPQARYVAKRREEYRKLYNLSDDGPDVRFWNTSLEMDKMLVSGLAELGKCPKFDDVVTLFTTPWPNGLRKAALKLHPEQGLTDYTLYTQATLLGEGRQFRWQLSADGKEFESKPQICKYE